MEQALYHPIHGYYSSERARIGRAGDFFTNVSVGDLFGEILAAQAVELFDLLGAPGQFKIAEQGAGAPSAENLRNTGSVLHAK